MREKSKNKNPRAMLAELEKKSTLNTQKDNDSSTKKQNERAKTQPKDECHGIQEDEFKVSNYFKITSKKNLTYKITLSGIFLALSVAVSALDIILEQFQIPIGQVYVSFRFLDLIVLLLGLSVLGPLFASLIGMIEPSLHNLIHGMHHGWIQPLVDGITNPIIIFTTWVIYYIVFKNSPYHKDPNKKKDWFKRLTPAAIMVFIAAFVTTLSFILALYIQDLATGTNLVPHAHHEHGGEGHQHHHHGADWDTVKSRFAVMFFALFGINILRYLIAYSCFVVFEGKMRPVNHRYR